MARQLKRIERGLFLVLEKILEGNGIKCPFRKEKYEERCLKIAHHLKCYGGLECSNLMNEILEQFGKDALRIYFTDAFLPKFEEMPREEAEGIEDMLRMLYKAAILDELMESRKKSIFFSEALTGGC